ncbi:MAG TPA: DUF4333 domain-containing protein [Kofleriaceae bacterium]|nr:DUF4333 domain-containing protein [Kofleriaceae bacterium]
MSVAAFAGSACKAKVDTKGFEDTIRQRTHDLGLVATKVVCPKDVEAKPGNVFTCQVELDGKKTYALDVTLKSVDSQTTKVNLDTAWHDGAAVQVAKLEPALAGELGKALGSAVTLKCGDEPLRFLDAQRKTRCELTAGTVKSTATIDFDEALAPTDWHLDPPLLGRAKLEEILTPSVREKTSPGVKVDCGPNALVPRPADGVVWCSIADADKQAKIKVEIDDKLQLQRWEVATPPG